MNQITKLFFLLLLLLCSLGICAQEKTDSVILQGLDKVTAKVYSVNAPIGSVVKFGNLKIIVHQCHKSNPEDPPESVAYLAIIDAKTGEDEQVIFDGYMFASSPAISCLEHPVYDVWIKECKSLPKHRTSSAEVGA